MSQSGVEVETESPDVLPHGPDVAQRQLGGRLGGLSLPRQVYILAIWPLLEQLMSFLVGFVDLTLAGHLRPESLKIQAVDGLGVASYVGWLMAIIHSSVGVGAAALIARAVGKRHRGLANAALGQSILLAAVSGAVVAVAVIALAPTIGKLAGRDGLSLALCTTYLRIVGSATLFSALMLVAASALRAAGDTRTPFLVMVVVNAANICFSVLFVYGPRPLGGHGVAGIAAGTFLAWLIGMVVIMTVLVRGWGDLRLRLHRLRPHLHTLYRIFRVSLPNLAESVGGMWLGNFLVIIIIGHYVLAEGVLGAHMIAIRVESLSFLAGFGLVTAAATLAGQYLGLGDPVRAKRAVLIAWWFALGIMVPMGVLFFLAPRLLAGIITDSPHLLALCSGPIRIAGPIQFFFATQMVFGGALRGVGDTRVTFLLTAGSTLLVRVPAVYLAAGVLGWGLNGVWIALCGELTFRSLIFAARFFHGGWTKIQV